jgi:hypothetical protein
MERICESSARFGLREMVLHTVDLISVSPTPFHISKAHHFCPPQEKGGLRMASAACSCQLIRQLNTLPSSSSSPGTLVSHCPAANSSAGEDSQLESRDRRRPRRTGAVLIQCRQRDPSDARRQRSSHSVGLCRTDVRLSWWGQESRETANAPCGVAGKDTLDAATPAVWKN